MAFQLPNYYPPKSTRLDALRTPDLEYDAINIKFTGDGIVSGYPIHF
jgi:hypothetical protein